jgi:hypothetical protein
MFQTEIIVKVAAEGGSLAIEGQPCGDTGWRFRMVRNEAALHDFCVDFQEAEDIAGFVEKTDYSDSLSETLTLFDRYPGWINLYPVDVHSAFLDEVLGEVRSRGGTGAEARWREAVDRNRRESEFNGDRTGSPTASRSHAPELDLSSTLRPPKDSSLVINDPGRVQQLARVAMKAPPSAVGRLLQEISWEGNARRYRRGGQGRENVLTMEVFQALDFLPRVEFLGRIIRSAECGSPATLNVLAEQVEELTFTLLPGDIDLASDPPKGKGRFHLQPDGILQSPSVYCMLEAKRIKRGTFQPEQLAKEFLAVLQEAGNRSRLLFLILPAPPPVPVERCGRLTLREAVANWLPRVLARADGEFAAFDDLCSDIESTLAYTTWRRVYEEVHRALSEFSSADPSVKRSVSRLANSVLDAITWHGEDRSD